MVTRRLAATLALLAALAPAARAASGGDTVFEFFSEEARATTALRRPASTDASPLAVDVITRREIEASGATNVWDLLRFRVGLDVETARSQAGYDRAVVSVRGLPRDAVTELRVMVDGRPVNSAMDQGVIWNLVPVQLQDLERVEIVRGPNAALYGSGAGTGVINFITRKPARGFAASATAEGGTQDTRMGAASVEGSGRAWGARASASDRFEGPNPAADGSGPADDWLRKQQGDVRAWFKPAEHLDLELQAGGVREGHGFVKSGDHAELGSDHYETLRLTRDFDGGGLLDLRLSRTDDQLFGYPDTNGGRSQTRWWRYEAEAYHSVPWRDGRLRTTYGIDWRYDAATADAVFGPDAGVKTNRTVRGFFHQEIKVLDTLSVLGGVSNETADAGGWHKDYQVAALWTPREDQSVRASYARANTMPGLLNRYAHQSFNNGNAVVIGSTLLNPSPLTDYELGWTGRFAERRVETSLTAYYTVIKDHLNLDQTANPPGYYYTLQYDNTNTVQLHGVEASAKWRVTPGRSVYANVTHETVTDQDAHALYLRTTPQFKANLGFDAELPWGLRASANAGYKDLYLADSNTGTSQYLIPGFWRLDARLAWTPRPRLTLFVSGANLLAPSRREYLDGLVVPRTVYGGATIRY
jgi:iron complex outermembrane receptor protein